MPLGRITLDDHVAAFDVTQSPQFSKKQTRSIVAAVLADQVGGNDRGDDGDPTGSRWLCACRKRPERDCASGKSDKIAPPHSRLPPGSGRGHGTGPRKRVCLKTCALMLAIAPMVIIPPSQLLSGAKDGRVRTS